LKTIIYLDQNYLSNLTQARLGKSPASPYPRLWESLRTAVKNGAAVCPFSPFRRTESEPLPSDDERDLYETAGEIHCGVEFQGFPEVLQSQVRASLKRFLGLGTHAVEPSDGFTADPHGPCVPSGDLKPWAARFQSWTRWVKDYHEHHGMPEVSGDYTHHKAVEARAIVENLYVYPVLASRMGSSNILAFSALDFPVDLFRAYEELAGTEDDGLHIAEFLRSKEMTETPFIDIHSSLVAGIITLALERKAQGSDLEDVLAISTVLPYCDILTTDRFMKHLVCALGLDDEYRAKVFSAARSDADSLCSVAERLASPSDGSH
jgi:hypothetical protein